MVQHGVEGGSREDDFVCFDRYEASSCDEQSQIEL